MPYIKVITNKTMTQNQKECVAKIVSEAITVIPNNKPEYLMAEFETNADLIFVGTTDPCAMIEMHFHEKAFGIATEAQWDEFFTLLTTMTAKLLDIPPERIYVSFLSVPKWSAAGCDILKLDPPVYD